MIERVHVGRLRRRISGIEWVQCSGFIDDLHCI
ncbi:unnamed protein product [Spirodela intermedia]|uniref:Uncharacterized protein n=2 Tax=Spirodela intermedia TaxID=51605 RepID=A0A7I8IHE5_SPIIN|nr:unnamed protein product [Spirodela intermedia]CAA6657214.1 unnamed protein product [Spirodela intermedia]CAA7393237.1 unnamed protein product [Spirodela intermedia]